MANACARHVVPASHASLQMLSVIAIFCCLILRCLYDAVRGFPFDRVGLFAVRAARLAVE